MVELYGGLLVEINLDVWPLVEELLPLLYEIERIEALAAGKNEAEATGIHGKETDQGPEVSEKHDGRMEER